MRAYRCLGSRHGIATPNRRPCLVLSGVVRVHPAGVHVDACTHGHPGLHRRIGGSLCASSVRSGLRTAHTSGRCVTFFVNGVAFCGKRIGQSCYGSKQRVQPGRGLPMRTCCNAGGGSSSTTWRWSRARRIGPIASEPSPGRYDVIGAAGCRLEGVASLPPLDTRAGAIAGQHRWRLGVGSGRVGLRLCR